MGMSKEAQLASLRAAGRYIRKLFGELEPRLKAMEDRNAALERRLDALTKKSMADDVAKRVIEALRSEQR